MSRRRRHEDHEEHENLERWLVSYADMMTLLVALFMMMYAMSVLDLKKYEAFQQAFTQGMGKHIHQLPGDGDPPNGEKLSVKPGALVGEPVAEPSAIPPHGQPVLDRPALSELRTKLKKELTAAGLDDRVQVALDPRGLVLYVTNGVLFGSGQAALTPQGRDLLVKVMPSLARISNPLVVEGHTDSRPISSAAFPSNWELSTARATAVLRALHDAAGVSTSRLSASGYADTKPRKPGTSEAVFALNRRVEIVVSAPSAAQLGAAGVPAVTAPAPAQTTAPEAAAEEPHEDEGHEEDSGGH